MGMGWSGSGERSYAPVTWNYVEQVAYAPAGAFAGAISR
jgi:hypothetical protein